MRRPRAFVALVILSGLVLAAAILRSEVADARSAAQAVTVDNTTANPVPVQAQGTVSVASQLATRSERCSMLNDDIEQCTFDPAMRVSLVVIRTYAISPSPVNFTFFNEGQSIHHFFGIQEGDNLVLPLTEPLAIESVRLSCLHACSGEVNLVGT